MKKIMIKKKPSILAKFQLLSGIFSLPLLLILFLFTGAVVFCGCENDDGGNTSETTGTSENFKLMYVFGGVNGGSAVEDPNVQISGLSVSDTRMSYHWKNGTSLAAWGLSDTDPGALACIFYYNETNNSWYGGKFDWISTSRLTRGFENINSGYHGWDYVSFNKAKKFAFCILSSNGKKRSNIITYTKK